MKPPLTNRCPRMKILWEIRMPFQPNQLIGPYALERQLGRGTFGEVWLAVHQDLGERRALKIPTDPRYVQQLRREGKIIYSLQHENIVRGCDMNTLNDPPYVAMEYIEGVTLRQKLNASGKLPTSHALNGGGH
ncbi:MAG: serine/threonine protein kinase [Tepidisphaerales bacterium]